MGDIRFGLKLGKINFLNVFPIYYPLEQGMIDHPFDIVEASPSELNRMIFSGELGISAVSSVEYGYHFENYFLIPHLSISSSGRVGSVILFSHSSLSALHGRAVLVSNKSSTSSCLLRLLSLKYWNISPEFCHDDLGKDYSNASRFEAVLAIGDDALKLKKEKKFENEIDLGTAWYEWTKKPFVFGVWVINRQIITRLNGHIEFACRALWRAKELGLRNLGKLVGKASSKKVLSKGECLEYFMNLRYYLTDAYLGGLECFFQHLFEAHMLPEKPWLRFYRPDRVLSSGGKQENE